MHFWFVIALLSIQRSMGGNTETGTVKRLQGGTTWCILHNPIDFYWQINRCIWLQAKWRKRIHCSFTYTVLQTFVTMPNLFFKSIKNSIPSHALYETHYSFYWTVSTEMTRRSTDCKKIWYEVKINGISRRTLYPKNWNVSFGERWFLERLLKIVGWDRCRLKSELAYMPLADISPLE